MAIVTVKELVDSGVHFGHQASRWNPKMRRFIYEKRNLIHVIDLRETLRGLLQARHFLGRLSAMGAQVLFVGTKRQIKDVVTSEAERCGMPFVTERWIGGTLTNYHTIKSRVERLEELERLEQEGQLERQSKKMQSRLRREMRKINRNLGGVRNLEGLPGAVVVIDPKREDIAVKEAARMNVPIVAILDTDCDPDQVDIPIPGNDDALRSVQLLLTRLVDGVAEGRQNMDREAMQFRSEVPEIRGREEVQERGRGRRPGGPSRGGGRTAGGRFAERHGGSATAASFGRATEEELEAQTKEAAAAAEAEKARQAEAAAQGDAPAPAAPAPEQAASEQAAPEQAAPDSDKDKPEEGQG